MPLIPKILDFNNYNRYPGDDNPTTDADMQDFLSNQNTILTAIADRLWQPETLYSVGDIVASPSMPAGLVAVCVIAGATSDVEPAWTGNETTVVDNYCTWEMRLGYSYALATEDDIQNAYDGQDVEPTHLVNAGVVGKIFSLVQSKFTALFGANNILPRSHGGTGVNVSTMEDLLKAIVGSGNIGSGSTPIYYSNGKLVAGNYTFRLNHNTSDTWIPVFSSGAIDYVLKSEIASAWTGGGIVAANLNTNGYVKFANGLILQWGNTNRNSSGDSGFTRITYPIAFNRCYMAIAVDLITSSHAMYGAMWKWPQAQYFDYKSDSDTASTPWIAIGI